MPHLHFGIATPQQYVSYDEMLKIWQQADADPLIDHMWVFDHFLPLGSEDVSGPILEGWTLLAALASHTSRVRVGVMVTGNGYRYPAVLAKQAVTVDRITQGRLIMGLGAGWNEREHTSYSIPFPPAAERVRRLDEACEVIQRLWTQTTASFDGQYYQLKEAFAAPKPVQQPHPPILIGAAGEKLMLRVVAKHANIWSVMAATPEAFRHKSAVLAEHCAAIGRDPAEIERLTILFADASNLAEVRANGQRFIDAGATQLVVNIRTPYASDIVRRLSDEVFAPLQAATLVGEKN